MCTLVKEILSSLQIKASFIYVLMGSHVEIKLSMSSIPLRNWMWQFKMKCAIFHLVLMKRQQSTSITITSLLNSQPPELLLMLEESILKQQFENLFLSTSWMRTQQPMSSISWDSKTRSNFLLWHKIITNGFIWKWLNIWLSQILNFQSKTSSFQPHLLRTKLLLLKQFM